MKSQVLSFLMATAVFTSGVSSAKGVHPTEVQVCTHPSNQANPHVFYPFVFWQDDRNGDWDIYAYDFDTQTEYVICAAQGNQTNPCILFGSILAEAIVVWEDDRNGNSDIYGYRLLYDLYDLAVGSEIAICIDPCDQRNPGSLGSYVYWQDNRYGDWDIRVKDYKEFEEPNEFVICGVHGDQVNPSAAFYRGGPTFVWQDNRSGDWDIYGNTRPLNFWPPIIPPVVVPIVPIPLEPNAVSAEPQEGDESDPNEWVICAKQGNQTNPSCSTFGIVWQDDRGGNNDIYGRFCVDILCSEFTEISVCTEPNDQMYPNFFGEVVVWQDSRNGGWDIYAYGMNDYLRGTEFAVSTAEGDQIRPVSDGFMVVWEDWRNGNGDIYAGILQGSDNCGKFTVELFDDQPYFGSTEGLSWTWTRFDEVPLTSSCGFYDFVDAWHVYKPAIGGPVTITTAGSSLDTVLSVFNSCPISYEYTSQIPHKPVELACNDDYCLEHAGSKVTLDVVKGKSYYVRVAGFNNQTGDYRIVVRRETAGESVERGD